MHHRTRRPAEPPLTGYTRSTSERRRLRLSATIVAPAAVIAIAAIATYVVLQDSPATGAADHAAVVAKPTAAPGPPVPQKPTEYAPPRPGATLPGDGQWIVGKDIVPGLYRSESGFLCYWERLSGLSGKYVDLIDNGGFRKGQLYVRVEAGDYAFTSQGCVKWERIR